MKHVPDISPLPLPARSVHRIVNGRGLQITTFSGTVWITQAADLRDVILGPGQSFVLDRQGLALVYAVRDAAIAVGPAGHISAVALAAPPAWGGAA